MLLSGEALSSIKIDRGPAACATTVAYAHRKCYQVCYPGHKVCMGELRGAQFPKENRIFSKKCNNINFCLLF